MFIANRLVQIKAHVDINLVISQVCDAPNGGTGQIHGGKGLSVGRKHPTIVKRRENTFCVYSIDGSFTLRFAH